MTVFAHEGHWAVQLIYLLPVAVLIAVIMLGRIRDRRRPPGEPVPDDTPPPRDGA